jgi:hypothetical protein
MSSYVVPHPAEAARQHCFYARPNGICISTKPSYHLQLARLDNGRALVVLDGAAAGTGSLKSLDNVKRLLVGNLAEDDVAAVEPGGDNGGDEELGAVAGRRSAARTRQKDL